MKLVIIIIKKTNKKETIDFMYFMYLRTIKYWIIEINIDKYWKLNSYENLF